MLLRHRHTICLVPIRECWVLYVFMCCVQVFPRPKLDAALEARRLEREEATRQAKANLSRRPTKTGFARVQSTGQLAGSGKYKEQEAAHVSGVVNLYVCCSCNRWFRTCRGWFCACAAQGSNVVWPLSEQLHLVDKAQKFPKSLMCSAGMCCYSLRCLHGS